MNSSDVSPVNDASSKYGASLIHLAANAAFHAATLPAFLPIRQIISPSVRLAGRRSWQKTFLHSAGEMNWRASIDGNRDKWRTAVKVKTISWKCLSMGLGNNCSTCVQSPLLFKAGRATTAPPMGTSANRSSHVDV